METILGRVTFILKYFSFDLGEGEVILHSLAIAYDPRHFLGQHACWIDVLYLLDVISFYRSLTNVALPSVVRICCRIRCLVDKIGDRVPGMELIRDDMTTEASADRIHVVSWFPSHNIAIFCHRHTHHVHSYEMTTYSIDLEMFLPSLPGL